MSVLDIMDLNMTPPGKQRAEVPCGTLDLIILKSLDTMGPFPGYAIARRIERVAGGSLRLSQGGVYRAFIRLAISSSLSISASA